MQTVGSTEGDVEADVHGAGRTDEECVDEVDSEGEASWYMEKWECIEKYGDEERVGEFDEEVPNVMMKELDDMEEAEAAKADLLQCMR